MLWPIYQCFSDNIFMWCLFIYFFKRYRIRCATTSEVSLHSKGMAGGFLAVKPFANAEKTHDNTLSSLTEKGLSLLF